MRGSRRYPAVAWLCWQCRTNLAQRFCAHQVHKTHPTHVQDDGVEADVGRCCQHRVGVCRGQDAEGAALQGGGAAQLPGALAWPGPMGRRAESDVGDAGTVGSRLVVVGVCWGGALKVLLELLQRQGLQQSGDAVRAGHEVRSWQVNAPLPSDRKCFNLD